LLQGRDRPIVIAHRGASGYLPEHTLESKALAYGLGADFLEQDVLATRDAELVVLHDLYLDNVTDVARRFPGRQRADGHYYVVDFDLSELRELRIYERRRPNGSERLYERRFASDTLGFRIVTLAEELQLVRGLNGSTGRNVGVYTEIKNPRWHLEHGIDLARLVLEVLHAHGYRSAQDPVFVQCFDEATLIRVRDELHSTLRLVQLVEDTSHYRELLSAAGLRRVASYAQGLGPAYAQLVTSSAAADGRSVLLPARLAADAKSAGLLLHPYTFRREQLPPYANNLEELLQYFLSELRVDGVFCDHPDVAIRVRDALLART
jgi:glycerophosphoryl diester phosphodiesterase